MTLLFLFFYVNNDLMNIYNCFFYLFIFVRERSIDRSFYHHQYKNQKVLFVLKERILTHKLILTPKICTFLIIIMK